MITDKIIWPPAYDPSLADGIVSNELIVKHMTPEELWPYLINISDWDRFSKDVTDTQFIDPSVEDPHLFAKAEFEYSEAGLNLAAHVLECVKPKADRPGRISWEGNIKGKDGAEFSFCQAWLLAMAPDHGTRILTEMSVKGSLATDELLGSFHNINRMWLEGLAEYTLKHLTQTNHPCQPMDGPTR